MKRAITEVKTGRYRYYKGKEYEVLGIARHSETLEELVVYRALYGDGQLWVRPKVMFLEKIITEGEEKPRFCYLAAENLRTNDGRSVELALDSF